MKITVIGTGYVGLVSGACLADVGHEVMCIDIDVGKVANLRAGKIPIYEPGLEALVRENVAAGRLSFSSDPAEGARFGIVQMIAVGTPRDEDGSADIQYVLAAARNIAQSMDGYRVVVDKSTVPVGTGDQVEETIFETLRSRDLEVPFSVVSNPEFLKEGAAVNDFLRPDRIVLGVEDAKAEEIMREVYLPFLRNFDRTVVMSRKSAELTKYAANAMLATRISFINELANLAERLGADIEDVRQGIGTDPRIGHHFLYPGIGYGGSCFPKDVSALIRTSLEASQPLTLLAAVQSINEHQKTNLLAKLRARYPSVRGMRFALWGLAFKPNTDDMRDAPSKTLIESLLVEGAIIQAYDPAAMDECRRIYGDRAGLILSKTPMEAIDGVDVLLIATEWKAFRSPDFEKMYKRMKTPVIFDGRNLYEPATMALRGFDYTCIGRTRAKPGSR
ncbi:MAG: UDP-glucose dehydrogenase family protein [Cellvibrionaceae bacterium]